MSSVIVAGLVKAVASFSPLIAQGLMERNEAIIRLRQKFDLDYEHLPDKFGVVYQYALIEYGAGKEETLIEIFEQKEIQDAFRQEFEHNKPSVLENAVDDLVNWEYVDWNTLGQNVKELDVDLRQEIEDFRKAFYKILPRTFTPSQVQQNKAVKKILDKIEKQNESSDEILQLVKELIKIIKSLQNQQSESSQQNWKPINSRLEETLRLYLEQGFRDDRAAKLEQAGEKDISSKINLANLFVDLDVKARSGTTPKDLKNLLQQEFLDKSEMQSVLAKESISVMDILLQEYYSKIVIIGIAGQGKSTISQQLAQIHRAKILNQDYDPEFQPKKPRIPFKVILKDFAQWLADQPETDALEVYLAEKVGKLAKRPEEVTSAHIQEILRNRDCLLILDGLDEVAVSKIQQQMLERIQDFLADAESLNAKVMVVATSRPNDYNNQFDPEKFWHLELNLLKQEKVQEYTEKWIKAKELGEDESCKIIPTLQECQNDPSVQGLLTTPLQVTIILIIIKGGRKPPSQREDLFNEYWLTIYRREEGKDQGKNIVKNNEAHLLDLHSYIGYILHRRAADQNIKSLLSTSEFKQEVSNFLNKKKGDRCSEQDITAEVEQLVKEVGDRLVLIFQKETDFYGFDLRSFQEFFAAVHLTKQAKDTKERFDRLETIAAYGHWRNVALFSAGRIARTFTGELRNLPSVWQTIDREKTNKYLKPGSWLALEIAADGSLTDHYHIQYSAIEDGLKVLDTGLTQEEESRLRSLLSRLSNKDKEQILRPVFEEKIRCLTDSCLLKALNIYVNLFGVNKLVLDKFNLLLQSKRAYLVNETLSLALKYKVEAKWLAPILSNNWNYAVPKLLKLFVTNFDYFKSILDTNLFSEAQLLELVEFTANNQFQFEYFISFYNTIVYFKSKAYGIREKDIKIIDIIKQNLKFSNPETFIGQIILNLQFYQIRMLYAFYDNHTEEAFNDVPIFEYKKNYQISLNSNIIINQNNKDLLNEDNLNCLNKLLAIYDLIPTLKFSLWEIYLSSPDIDNNILSNFINDLSRELTENSLSSIVFRSVDLYPTVSLIIDELQAKRFDINNLAANLEKYYTHKKQIIEKEDKIVKSVRNTLTKLDDNQKIDFVHRVNAKYNNNISEYFNDLASSLEIDQLSIENLFTTYLRFSCSYAFRNIVLDVNDRILSSSISDHENILSNSDRLTKLLIYLTQDTQWVLSIEGYQQACKFLTTIIEQWKSITENQVELSTQENLINVQQLFCLVVAWFLKLLTSRTNFNDSIIDTKIEFKKLASQVFNLLTTSILLHTGDDSRNKTEYITNVFKKTPENILNIFINFLNEEEDINLFIGSVIIIKSIIQSDKLQREINNESDLISININPKVPQRLIGNSDSRIRQMGTVLLTRTEYPIADEESRNLLVDGCKNALNEDEERAWSDMLKQIPTVDEQKPLWSDFLENILANPRDYGSLILDAAMERYQKLNSINNATISEEDEKRLGLP